VNIDAEPAAPSGSCRTKLLVILEPSVLIPTVDFVSCSTFSIATAWTLPPSVPKSKFVHSPIVEIVVLVASSVKEQFSQ